MKRLENSKKYILLLSLVMILAIAVNSTIAFIQAQAQPLTNTFKPDKYISNDLIISKEVKHPFGAGYVIPENISFDFEVNLGEIYANTEIVTSEGTATADENGKITVKIRPDMPLSVKGLVEGTQITVKELEAPAGFSAESGTDLQQTVISADKDSELNFINIYTPSSVKTENIELKVKKVLTGRAWKEGDSFTFLLEYDGGKGEWTKLAEKSAAFGADADYDTVHFGENLDSLEISETGTYAFRISEIAGDIENVRYDSTVHNFRVTVTDEDMDGKLEISDIIASEKMTVEEDSTTGTTSLKAEFKNIYSESKDVTVEFKVNKTVKNTGSDSIGPENFSFVLENTETGEKLTAKTDESGKAVFELTYTADDAGKTFIYKLSEKDEGKDGVTYSDKVYNVKVEVTLDAQGNTAAAVYCAGEPVTDFVADFENIYNKTVQPPEDSAAVRIPIVKTIKSDDAEPIGPGSFEFELENTETGEKLTAKTDSDGNATFNLTFRREDAGKTYTYKLSEKNDGREGVTYSDTVYDMDIAVMFDDSDNPVAVLYVGGEVAPEDFAAAFENIYRSPTTPDDIVVKLKTKKTVINSGKAEIGPEGFEFVLEDTASGEKLTQVSDNEGAAEFSLTYSANDIGKTYSYKITETNDGREGVIYSEAVYEIQTAITLGEDGKLNADIFYEGSKVIDFTAEFKNEYKPKFDDITVELTAQKKIKNETEEETGLDGFSFVLEDTDTHRKLTEKSDENGLAVFKLTFTEEHIGKTLNYKLTEKNDEQPGFVYSTKEYEVHIAVKIGDDGKLKAVITSGNAEVEQFKAEFENIYKGIPIENIVVPVTVYKTVVCEGEKTIGPENFRFKLTDENGFGKFAVTDNDGMAEFRLSFTEEDVGKSFSYKFVEVNDGVKGVTYSDAVYSMRIDVKLDEENKVLVAEMFMDDAQTESLSAEFENKYKYTGTKPPSGGGGDDDYVKTGDDANLTPWMIMFVLSTALLIVLILTGKKPEEDETSETEA